MFFFTQHSLPTSVVFLTIHDTSNTTMTIQHTTTDKQQHNRHETTRHDTTRDNTTQHNATQHTTGTPRHTSPHRTTSTPQAHLHLQRRYRPTSFKVARGLRKKPPDKFCVAHNSPNNECAKVHAPWYSGKVRASRTKRESQLNE